MYFKMIALASALVLAPSLAFSQDATSPETPAISTPESNNPSAPVKGENSFTEGQAKEKFEKAGYSNVIGLKLTEDGIWEASAMKGTDKVSVQLDYQGNVTKKHM